MKRPNLVVTQQTPQHRRLRIASMIVGVCIGGLLVYELGLSRAGFSRIDSMTRQSQLEAENRELAARNKGLSERLAALEVAAKIDRQAYSKVENELIELQTRILQQQEDIEFYKGIVNENDGTGLRIQDFQISRGIGEREFDLRLVLAQAFRSDRQVSGEVSLVIEGVQRGEAARLDLAAVAGPDNGGKPLQYSFRYFQDLKAALLLPEDFVPERVQVIVKTKGKSAKTVEEFFIWEVKPG